MDTKLYFQQEQFTILQVSDPQDLSFMNHTMRRMLNKAYDTVKPNLVVFTGDNILGNHLRDARFGNRITVHTTAGEKQRMEKAIDNILQPLLKRNIPFTFVYGNHDDRNAITKKEQAEIYRSYPNCRGLNTTDETVDCDTFVLPIYAPDGKTVLFNLWMLDSAWYNKDENVCYELVKPEAVAWFSQTAAALKKKNGAVPGLLFQHIPLPETLSLLEECPPYAPGAVQDRDGKRWFKLNPAKATGILGEYPGVCQENTGLFDAVLADGTVLAIVTGHDHYNCFEGEISGVRLLQSSCASFRCYGGRQRGVRVFSIPPEEPAAFRTQFLTYSALMGTGIAAELAYLLDADGMQKKKYAFLTAAGAIIAGIAAAGIHCLRYRK